MNIIIGLSVLIVLLLAVVGRLAWKYREMLTKKNRSIVIQLNEQDRLRDELEALQIEKLTMERLLLSTITGNGEKNDQKIIITA
jgi:F0F1-type ATP synthase membrane subunit b/b'